MPVLIHRLLPGASPAAQAKPVKRPPERLPRPHHRLMVATPSGRAPTLRGFDALFSEQPRAQGQAALFEPSDEDVPPMDRPVRPDPAAGAVHRAAARRSTDVSRKEGGGCPFGAEVELHQPPSLLLDGWATSGEHGTCSGIRRRRPIDRRARRPCVLGVPAASGPTRDNIHNLPADATDAAQRALRAARLRPQRGPSR